MKRKYEPKISEEEVVKEVRDDLMRYLEGLREVHEVFCG